MQKKEDPSTKKEFVTHLAVLVVVVGLILIAFLVVSSNFNFVDFVIRLHGG